MYKTNKDNKSSQHSCFPGRINNYTPEDFNLKENCCVVFSFSKSAYCYTKNIMIKSHIFFSPKKPEIYLHPIRKIFSICLHPKCDICKFWISKYIDGNPKLITKVTEVLYNGQSPILLMFSPYLRQLILYSDMVNKELINATIIKKVMPYSGNLFISAQIDVSYNNQRLELLKIFKELTENSWSDMNDKDFAVARCSVFMNFVNENDIYYVEQIFPKETYDIIVKICSYIKYKNYLLFPKKMNIISKLCNNQSLDDKNKGINDDKKDWNSSDESNSAMEETNSHSSIESTNNNDSIKSNYHYYKKKKNFPVPEKRNYKKYGESMLSKKRKPGKK